MNRPHINVDLDGVLYDFENTFRAYASNVLGHELPEWHTWDAWRSWGISESAWMRLFRTGVESGDIWGHGAMVAGAFDGLWALSDSEWHIRILTTRLVHRFDYATAVSSTVAWLKDHGLPYRSLAVIGPGDDKFNYQATALVDDKWENIRDFAAVTGVGVLFNRPWNYEAPVHRADGKVFRAIGWPSVVDVVNAIDPRRER